MPQLQAGHVATYDFGAPVEGAKATGQVSMQNNPPQNGDTVTLVDAEGEERTFEFDPQSVDDGVQSDHTEVAFDDTVATAQAIDNAISALADAINNSALLIDALADTANNNVDLEQTEPLESGNTAIQKNVSAPADLTTTDFSGGAGRTTERRTPIYSEPRAGGGTPAGQRRRIPLATPVEWRVADGGFGKHFFNVQNEDGVRDLTVTIEVSEDGLKYRRTTSAANLNAVQGVTVQRKTNREFTVLTRPGKDKYVRLFVTGGARGVCQVRPEGNLDPLTH